MTDSSRQFNDVSVARIQGLQSAWIQQRIRSSLPGDEYVISGNIAILDSFYSALSEEFKTDGTFSGGVFSADRARNVETRHYSSVAICIRSSLPLQAMKIPVLGPAIFSLLSLYYGHLHGHTDLVEMAYSSYTMALGQYHQYLKAFMLGQNQN